MPKKHKSKAVKICPSTKSKAVTDTAKQEKFTNRKRKSKGRAERLRLIRGKAG